jgi:uncharacterized caspase-like protein
MENDWCWTEVMRSSVNLSANKNKQNQIPVINNRYAALSNFKDLDSGRPKHQQNRNNGIRIREMS